jgi:hypothetical protein
MRNETRIRGTIIMNHPAKYSDELIPVMVHLIRKYGRKIPIIVDPFAGTGKIFDLYKFIPGCSIFANELEPEWAHPECHIGDALNLPWMDHMFNVCCTSPTYGNRMADHHEAKDDSERHTYRHCLGRPLSPNNSGAMQWGAEYCGFHLRAWREASRVLCKNGLFILNISNHIRKGQEQMVSEWHRDTLIQMGYVLLEDVHVATLRNRNGANADLRVDYEHVYAFKKSQ